MKREARPMRRWIWHQLIFLADRIAPDEAFRGMGFSFTFEEHVGIVFHEDRRGCPLWYYGPDYDRAFAPSAPQPRPPA